MLMAIDRTTVVETLEESQQERTDHKEISSENGRNLKKFELQKPR